MADVVTPEIRSRMMAGIKGKNTKPEVILRRGLHKLGFRFVLHKRTLPGRPDLVFPKYHAALFAHGCFWHGHDCQLFKWPKTRARFWKKKIFRNRTLDSRQTAALIKSGWRVGIVWECALKGRGKIPEEILIYRTAKWLRSPRRQFLLKGRL